MYSTSAWVSSIGLRWCILPRSVQGGQIHAAGKEHKFPQSRAWAVQKVGDVDQAPKNFHDLKYII